MRPACNAVADRRMLNLRPSCASYAAGMKNPSKRSTRLQQAGALRPKGPWPKHLTYLDHGVETEAQRALRPRCPAGEAINSNRQTGVQRKKGLSLQPPDWCPKGEGLITPTHWTRPRTKGLSLRPSARAACEGLNHFALAAFPRGRPCGTTLAEGLTSRFLGRETLEKPDNDLSITPHQSVGKGFGALLPKVFDPVQFSSEKPQQKFGKRRPDTECGYFRHRPRVRIRRTHRSTSRFARALRVS